MAQDSGSISAASARSTPVRKMVDVAYRGERELGGRAVGLGDPRAVPVLAEVGPPDRAEAALSAGERRVDADQVARGDLGDLLADRLDHAGGLVPGNDREHGRRELAVEHVQIGATDADRLDPDHDLAWPGHRIRSLLDRQLARSVEDDRAHLLDRAHGQAADESLLGEPAGDDDGQHSDGGGGGEDGEELSAAVDEAAEEGWRGTGDDGGEEVGEEVLVPGEDEDRSGRLRRRRARRWAARRARARDCSWPRRSGRLRRPRWEPLRRRSASSTPRGAG